MYLREWTEDGNGDQHFFYSLFESDHRYECRTINAKTEPKCLHVDRFFGRFRLQEQQLRDDQRRDIIVYRSHQTDNPFLKKSAKDVIRSFTSTTLLDDWQDEDRKVIRWLIIIDRLIVSVALSRA